MRRLFITLLAILSVYSAQSQLPSSGYYRVMNYGSNRYAYLCDRTGSLNYSTQNADIGALQLWLNLDRALDNPASIIYVQSMGGDRYDLKAQGTGLYEIIGHYCQVSKQGDNQFWVYATQSGISKYLGDSRTNSKDQGVPSFDAKGNYIKWSLFPINESDNYLGITPTFHTGGKHYAFYYVSFPFRKVSSGLKVYYISKIDNDQAVAVMKEITSDIIPPATPVVIECPSASAADNRIMPVTGGGTAPTNNLLAGVYFCNDSHPSSAYTATPFNAASMRALGVLSNGKLGFISDPDYLQTARAKQTKYTNALPANSSYLKVPSGTPAQLTAMTEEEYNSLYMIHATSIKLSQTTAELYPGSELQLTATVGPEEATDKTVSWSMDKEGVVSVDNGKVVALAVGEVTVTATTNDGSNLTASCKITVKPIMATKITVSQETAELYPTDVLQLSAIVLPENATDKSVKWESSKSAIATVDENGKVTALAIGEATITATTKDGSNLSASCKISVKPVLVKEISLSQTTAELYPGNELQLTATVLPENATDKTVSWTVDKTGIVSVVDGKVTALAVGEVTVTAKTNDGSNLSATCKITVKPVLVKEITISKDAVELNPKDVFQLTATVLPENATNKVVKWESDKPSVASVSADGKVTAIAIGDAIITATTTDGTELSASCQVKVSPLPVKAIKLSQDVATLHVDESVTLTTIITPDNATDKRVKWETSKPEVAKVDDNGTVTALTLGETIISATTLDGTELSATCLVKVEPLKVSEIRLSKTSVDLYPDDELQLTATVLPDNATDKSIKWESKNPAVATVNDDGKVTAHAVGDAIIVVTASDGSNVTAQCVIKVNPILVKSLTLSEKEVDAIVGDRIELKATVLPENATDQTLTWTTSNKAVATVDADGVVVVLAEGKTIITVSTNDGSKLSAQCTINAKKPTVLATDVILDIHEIELGIARTARLTATVLPEEASTRSVTWRSTNESVVTVSKMGLIMGVGEGEALVIATTVDGTDLSDTCEVKVVPVPVERISMDGSATVGLNRTLLLKPTLLPTDATSKSLKWTSSNNSIATVSQQGLVTGKSLGDVVITATTTDGTNLSATCKVKVAPVLVETISLDVTSASIVLDQTLQLTATVTPDDATSQEVKWESSNLSIATVDANGLVTAKGVGDVIITVTSTDGSDKSATCVINVLPILAEKIEISQTEAELEEGKTLQLTATVLPENTTDNSVKWESEDETIATVDENGLVTAVSHGETVIKVTAQDGSSVIATCVLKVLLPDGIAQISATDRQMQIYSLDGRRLNAFQKGVNIVRMADGTVRRIAVK